ncbi:hypothetical protein G6F22_021480 [Rhizopus arrhizus]|nr:hypothetical protein G6F22_021480 [Rhizopus arrhizus]
MRCRIWARRPPPARTMPTRMKSWAIATCANYGMCWTRRCRRRSRGSAGTPPLRRRLPTCPPAPPPAPPWSPP